MESFFFLFFFASSQNQGIEALLLMVKVYGIENIRSIIVYREFSKKEEGLGVGVWGCEGMEQMFRFVWS